jgi:hypothetical protein
MKKERPSWRIAVAVFWAQLWRGYLMVFLVGAVFVGVTQVFDAAFHKDIRQWLLYPMLLVFVFVEIWAIRESLVDRYKSFELITKERDVPL